MPLSKKWRFTTIFRVECCKINLQHFSFYLSPSLYYKPDFFQDTVTIAVNRERPDVPIELLHNERQLFSQLSLGDANAFTTVFHFYSRRLYPWLLKKTKDSAAAEEIIQDTFLKIWINREKLSKIDNPEGYIYRIAANLTLDHFRKLAMEHKILNRFQTTKSQVGLTDALGTIDLREMQKIIDQAVHYLPDQRKRIYTLRQEGMSYQEIADQLQLSVNTVKNQLIAAGKSIRVHLVQNGISSLILIIFYTTL